MQYQDPDDLAKQCAEHMWANDAMSQKMGMQIIAVSQGNATLSMRISKDMLNGHQTCHGGQLFSLADSAFAFACNSQNQAAVAANCMIDFIRPAFADDLLTATASVVNQGKRSGLYHIKIHNQDNDLIVIFRGNSARINRPVLPISQS
ncbi:MAG: acyl-CoA thioesterase [Paraglaciecola sp.]|jgi:acyl-CoA thioesterase